MADNPFVSVLMTTYNREKYVVEAIESVLKSSFEDFELIVCDDRSTDRTVDFVRELAHKDSRVKLFVNDKNLGDYPNRNEAARHARGKYIKYVDADDYLYPWGLGILVKCMEAFPAAGWGLCSLLQDTSKPFPFLLNNREAYEYHYFGPGLFHKAPLSSIIRREVFEQVGGFIPQRMVGDSDMWHRLAASFPVLLMTDGIVWYREHDAQEINHVRNFLLDYESVVVRALESENCPLTQAQKIAIYKDKKRKTFARMLIAGLQLKKNDFLDSYRVLKFYLRK